VAEKLVPERKPKRSIDQGEAVKKGQREVRRTLKGLREM